MIVRRLIGVSAAMLTVASVSAAPPAVLPANLVAVRSQIIAICKANTLRMDNIDQVRNEIEPLVGQLAAWYNTNRPAGEVQMTQRSWKSIWYQNPVIDTSSYGSSGRVSYGLNRDAVYQVVKDGYYYNVSELIINTRRGSQRTQSFLKGAYTLGNVAGAGNVGQPKLNVVDLEFVYNGVRWGALVDGIDLNQLVLGVENKSIRVYGVPGPIGVTGELWNVYVDDELRIARGAQDNVPGSSDLYVLIQADKTGPQP